MKMIKKSFVSVVSLVAGLLILGACASTQNKTTEFRNPSSANRFPPPGYMYK